ncbi:hypothetical protein AAFN60_21315 [Roseibacillus persicicus]|uniref:hypothetical protein n=1 Tax=Roseibacillus persicicus TaxID=454148 RepID=UPI00398B5FE8
MSSEESALVAIGKEAIDRADKLVKEAHLFLIACIAVSIPEIGMFLGKTPLPIAGKSVFNSAALAGIALVYAFVHGLNFCFICNRLRLISEQFAQIESGRLLFLHPSKLTDRFHIEVSYTYLLFPLSLISATYALGSTGLAVLVSLIIAIPYAVGSWHATQASRPFRIKPRKANKTQHHKSDRVGESED